MPYERRTKGETALFALGSKLAVMTCGWALRRLGRWLDGAPVRIHYLGSRPHDDPRAANDLPAVHHQTAHLRHDHGPGKIITQPEYAARYERKYRSPMR